MLRVYTDFNLLGEGEYPCVLLLPFVRDVTTHAEDADVDANRFSEYFKAGVSFFEIVNCIEDAQLCVMPMEYSHEHAASEPVLNFVAEAKRNGTPCLVFYNNDDNSDIRLQDVIVFRTSFYRSSKRNYEFAYPAWSVDFSMQYTADGFIPLQKEARPRISYCGYVDYSSGWCHYLNHLLKRLSGRYRAGYGTRIRGRAVRSLVGSSGVDTEFIIRNGFWAKGLDDKVQARTEYAENMLSSPYGLVVRGAGNFSYRLYELMSAGRIPVFVDTDCVLPFEDQIDWDSFVLRVPVSDISRIDEVLLDFHYKISSSDFIERQRLSRLCYEEWIRPEAFFRQLRGLLEHQNIL